MCGDPDAPSLCGNIPVSDAISGAAQAAFREAHAGAIPEKLWTDNTIAKAGGSQPQG
jgi:hypothetical protein